MARRNPNADQFTYTLINKNGGHNKFYAYVVRPSTGSGVWELQKCYGRIGTQGQQKMMDAQSMEQLVDAMMDSIEKEINESGYSFHEVQPITSAAQKIASRITEALVGYGREHVCHALEAFFMEKRNMVAPTGPTYEEYMRRLEKEQTP